MRGRGRGPRRPLGGIREAETHYACQLIEPAERTRVKTKHRSETNDRESNKRDDELETDGAR